MPASLHRLFFPLLLTVPLVVGAVDFTTRYPAGSLSERSQAETAKREAEAEIKRLGREESQRNNECYRKILVNDCLAAVRKESELKRREAKRVDLEAKDLIRSLDAKEAAQRKIETDKKQAEQDAARANKDAGRAQKPASTPAAPRITAEQAEANRKAATEREAQLQAKQAQAQARDAQSATKAQAYQIKQDQAAQRAAEAAVKKANGEKKRAEQRQKNEADRADLMRRADEAAAAARP